MLPSYAPPDLETLAEDLTPLASKLVDRIRTETLDPLCRELLGRMDGWELWGLICQLANTLAGGRPATAETPEDRQDRLAEIAVEISDRIRTEPVGPLLSELLDDLPRVDVYGVVGLLGGATDPSVSSEIWWGWARYGVTAATAEPIRWPGDEDRDLPPELAVGQVKTVEDPTTARIRRLAEGLHYTDRQIGVELGLKQGTVQRRRLRADPPIRAGCDYGSRRAA